MDAELFAAAMKTALKPVIAEMMTDLVNANLKPIIERLNEIERQNNVLDKVSTENLISSVRSVIQHTPEITEQITHRIMHNVEHSFERRMVEAVENNGAVREAIDTYVVSESLRNHDFTDDIKDAIREGFDERVRGVIDEYDFSDTVSNAIENDSGCEQALHNMIDSRIEDTDLDDKITSVIKNNLTFTVEVSS